MSTAIVTGGAWGLGTILYLAGSGSDFVTGQNIVVNGGGFFQ